MTISMVGAVSSADAVAGRLALGTLEIFGPDAEGAPLMARMRLPVCPFTAADDGAQQVAGPWFGTVRRDGGAARFRLASSDGTLVLTGAVGSELMLDAPRLACGKVIDIVSGRLTMPPGGRPDLDLRGMVSTAEPAGQEFHVHWDSWFDTADPAYPERLHLTRLPPYVAVVTLCFVRPQVSYESLDDDVHATTGLQFHGSGHRLKTALDLLRMRRPDIRIALGVQQGGALGFEPYDRDGWAGMNPGHFRALRTFAEHMGIRDITVDYECVSSLMESGKHCIIDGSGAVRCHTDGELVRIVKTFRRHFPRPRYRLAIDGYNTGAYFGPFARQPPVGWNHGYVAALAVDPEARAAIDAINIMSFDEKPGYDPIRALQAYRHHFPDAAVFAGLRSGPPWHGDVKRSLTDCLELVNAAIRLGAGGIWLHALLWDLGEPHGPHGPDNPDADMMGRLVAERLRLPGADQPLMRTGL